MDKLISRNPVQRFKQGRKIVFKAQLGGYMFGKMGGWNRSMGNTISDQESLNYLKEMGLDGQNALQIQQYINQQFGKNSVKEDNRWGNQSKAGLKALYENWKLQQKPQTQSSPIGNSVIEAQRALEEIPQLSQDQLMFNNINSKTFNAPVPPRTIPYDRSMTRDIIKDITGNSAYNFTGDQRKALRQYLNGEQYDQEAIKAFGDLNQYNKYMKWRLQKGGILPSINIVERFKNGRKIVKAQYSWGPGFGLGNTAEKKKFQEVKKQHNIQKATDDVMNTTKEITPTEQGRYNKQHPLGSYNLYDPEQYYPDNLEEYPLGSIERELIKETFPTTYKIYNGNGELVKKFSNLVSSDFEENLVNNRKLIKELPKVAIDNMKKQLYEKDYENIPLDSKRSYAAQKTKPKESKKEEKPSTTQKVSTIDKPKEVKSSKKVTSSKNNSSKGSSFAKAFKEARAKGLKEFVWNGQKKNTMKAGETREQWLKNLGTKKTPQQKEVVTSSQPAVEKVKTQTVVPASQEIGNWTQALINAQNNISEENLNTQKEVKDLTKKMVVDREDWNYTPNNSIQHQLENLKYYALSPKYKQGGILPSRNPVKRFKNRNFS